MRDLVKLLFSSCVRHLASTSEENTYFISIIVHVVFRLDYFKQINKNATGLVSLLNAPLEAQQFSRVLLLSISTSCGIWLSDACFKEHV